MPTRSSSRRWREAAVAAECAPRRPRAPETPLGSTATAGSGSGLHDLRHSFVALALAAGLSLAEAAALARHANARVTAQVYAGLADDGREAAAAKLVQAGFGG